MELINKPISESASRILAIIATDVFYHHYTDHEGNRLIIVDSVRKNLLSKRTKLSEKRINNLITELVATHRLLRLSPNQYKLAPGIIIEENTVVLVPDSFVFSKG